MQTVMGYFGVQGSGKSYEIVKNVIVPALRDTERRVVANIEGLNALELSKYLGKDVTDRVVLYEDMAILEPGFLPTERMVKSGEVTSFVKPGDLIIVDEAARTFGKSKRPPEWVLDFLRMARHMTDANGQPCNVVFAAQALTMLHADLRCMFAGVVKFRKHIALGMPHRYIGHIYDGDKPTRDALISSFQESYSPEIFPLYKSHSGAQGKETAVDERQNFFKGAGFKAMKRTLIGIPVLMALCVAFLWWKWSSFKEAEGVAEPAQAKAAAPAPGGAAPAAAGTHGPGQYFEPVDHAKDRAVLGLVETAAGRMYVIVDGPDGSIILDASTATITDTGIWISHAGQSYSSLVRPPRNGGGTGVLAAVGGSKPAP